MVIGDIGGHTLDECVCSNYLQQNWHWCSIFLVAMESEHSERQICFLCFPYVHHIVTVGCLPESCLFLFHLICENCCYLWGYIYLQFCKWTIWYLWPTIHMFYCCGYCFLLLSFFLAYSQRLQIGCLPHNVHLLQI